MKHLFTLLFIALLFSCANIIPPSGGPKDTSAPSLISSIPTINTLNFDEKKLIFTFDEKIVAENFNNQFFISPPLEKKVDYTIKSNKLTVHLNQDLKKNTTYYVSLGKSISDLNEGNAIYNESIVFSTGAHLDTLYIKGKVNDIINGNAIENCWLFLHTYKEDQKLDRLFNNANFLAKTDENGYFSFPNLTEENFHIVALMDIDNNLTYSLKEEKIGFLDSLNISQTKIYNINIFSEIDSLEITLNSKLDSISSIGKLIVDSIPLNCIIELYNENGIISRGFGNKQFIADSIQSGKYKLRLINDKNQNGKWDSGNLEKRIQAEEILFYPENIQIRSNWDLEVIWKTKL